jgi:hypothetical protein
MPIFRSSCATDIWCQHELWWCTAAVGVVAQMLLLVLLLLWVKILQNGSIGWLRICYLTLHSGWDSLAHEVGSRTAKRLVSCVILAWTTSASVPFFEEDLLLWIWMLLKLNLGCRNELCLSTTSYHLVLCTITVIGGLWSLILPSYLFDLDHTIILLRLLRRLLLILIINHWDRWPGSLLL